MLETPHLPDGEQLYRRIVEDSPAAVVLLTSEASPRVLFASSRIEEISGFSPTELLDRPEIWLERLHPIERASMEAEWASAVGSGERFTAQYRFRHRNGEWRWFRETSSPVREADGSIRYWQSFIADITAERFAEDQAARSEARYRALVERLPVIVYVDSDESRPRSLYVSPNSREILGYEPRDFLANPNLWFESMHPDDLDRVHEIWSESIRTRRPFRAEYRNLKPDGAVVWVRDHSILVHGSDGEPLFWQGVLHDITAEREAEMMLDRSEARYRELLEHLPVIVYVDAYGPSVGSRYVSPNVVDMLGHAAEEFLADTGLWLRLLHPDDRELARAAWSRGWAEETGWSVEYRFLLSDGREVWVRDEASMVIDPATGEQTWQGVIIDLTEARRAEADMRSTDRRYRALVDQVPAIMYEMGPDDERRTLFVSPHVEQILGYPRQEWLDQPDIWTELLHPDDRETELAAHDLHNETGASWQREYRLIASDGREVWVRDQAELVIDDDGARWLGVMLDISPQKEAEAQLQLANDELEMRVLTRTAQLEDANEMLTLEIGERRRAEEQVRGAEHRFRAIVEHRPSVAYTWKVPTSGESTHHHLHRYTNPRIEDLLGFTVAEWESDPMFWQTRLHPHDRERVLVASRHSMVTGEIFNEEFRYLAKDGRVVWVLERAVLLSRDDEGRPQFFQGLILDVTDRMRAVQKAEAAEERFRLLAERGPLVVYEFALEHAAAPQAIRMRYLSPSAAEMLRMPTSTWEGDIDAWLAMMHPDDLERMTERAHDALASGGPWTSLFRMIAGDGRVVWVLDRGQAIEHDHRGRPTLFQGVLLDVTDEAEVHASLGSWETTFRSIVESIPAVPWTEELVGAKNNRSRFTFIGPQVDEVFGYTNDELLAEPDHFFRLVHPDDRERVIASNDRCDRTGEPWEELYWIVRRDGAIRWILSQARRSPSADRPVWHGVAVDVTRLVDAGSLSVPAGDAIGEVTREGTVEMRDEVTGGVTDSSRI